ncbi:ECF transporter S component [Corynebacterium pelargi]|uniref:Uncharacterized protein n=1 Tax=Corynebacterium pelargi TaxID=1471400 RepID=A0A410WB35_9CORY|nr:hypothetical protein CPELA_09690 [Corynebacterium pelargi]GGG74156.1 hypothetical protein GCM10007338_09430 [Corynebacterium pelargi]
MSTISNRRSYILTGVALAIMALTWLILVLMHPEDQWDSLAQGPGAVVALLGFSLGAIVALVAVIPVLHPRALALIPVALVLNIVLGQIVGTNPLPIPLYLDSIGTVLVAALCGPRAGMATGALSALVWGTFNPTVVPFAADYAMIGLLAGLAPWVTRRWLVPIWGAFVGLLSALMAAPIASFIFGGTAGTGTGLLVSFYRQLGLSPMSAVYAQSLSSDPIDKVIVFSLVLLIVAALPKRTMREFRPKDAAPKAVAPKTTAA